MSHCQGSRKDDEMQPDKKQPNENPNKDSKTPEAPMEVEVYVEVPPWEAPPKLLAGLDWPTEGKAKGKTHPQHIPEWVTNSRVLLSGPYGVTDCKEEGCTNPGRAWSKGMLWKEYYCDVHHLLLWKKHWEQSKLNRAKQWKKAHKMREGACKSQHLKQQQEEAKAETDTKSEEEDLITAPICHMQPWAHTGLKGSKGTAQGRLKLASGK